MRTLSVPVHVSMSLVLSAFMTLPATALPPANPCGNQPKGNAIAERMVYDNCMQQTGQAGTLNNPNPSPTPDPRPDDKPPRPVKPHPTAPGAMPASEGPGNKPQSWPVRGEKPSPLSSCERMEAKCKKSDQRCMEKARERC